MSIKGVKGMANDYQKLYIYTFGNLVIRKNDSTLFSGNRNLNKRWKLFLILLINRGKTISDQKLIEELNLHDNITPIQSLRALIYRIRKQISKKENQTPFIYTDNGGYGFNPDSNYWLDAEEFKKIALKKENNKVSHKKLLRKYNQALDLYNGSFLEDQNLDNNQLLKKRYFYRVYFLKVVQKKGDILEEEGRCEEAIDLYETALQLYPLNAGLYINLVETLKKVGKAGLAQIRAEEALSFLKNAGVNIPPKLEKEAGNFTRVDFDKNPEFALKNNCDGFGNVFECGPLTFSNIYNLEKRRSKRAKKNIYLIHYKLNNSERPEDMREAEKILREILHEYLRSSDVVTRWQPNHYLQLAVGIDEDKIKKILSRIEENFQKEYPPLGISLSYKYQKI